MQADTTTTIPMPTSEHTTPVKTVRFSPYSQMAIVNTNHDPQDRFYTADDRTAIKAELMKDARRMGKILSLARAENVHPRRRALQVHRYRAPPVPREGTAGHGTPKGALTRHPGESGPGVDGRGDLLCFSGEFESDY